jgi:electron transport complex protein RnfC
VKTFRKGGVHPQENKFAHNAQIEVFPLPKQAVLYATQHLGAPDVVVVAKGDFVKTGQLIAKGEAFISANLHSPYTGTVAKVEPALDIIGYKQMAITIDVAEEEQWMEDIDLSPEIKREISLSDKEIIEKIKEKGIVGLGGACFPTHVKLMVPEGKKAEYHIVNAAECEPYICVDNRIMIERTEEFLIGACILRKALGLSVVDIGIEHNKPEAIARVKEVAASFEGVRVHVLQTKYPQGAEKQLIKAIANREVPAGKLPIDVGCVVDNVATALAVYEAVQKNKPLIESHLTYSGKHIVQPKNYRVRLGTPIVQLVEANGGLCSDTEKVISGGPMMGKAIANLNAHITKGFTSLLQIGMEEAKRLEPVNCIRCGKCVDVCPMGLEPYLLAPLTENARWEDTEKECITSCIECGSCQFICPANRPLLDYIRLGKSKVNAMIRERGKK